jgi:hypothetical protein
MTIGYIVECHGRANGAMEIDSRDGELYFGRAVTLFPSHYDAKKAIHKTISRRASFASEFGRLEIKRLVPMEVK